MRQTALSLTEQERLRVDGFRSKGELRAREVNRAHILAALDSTIPENQIMAVLGVGRTAIRRTRVAYLQGGLEFALQDMARPGKPRQYRTDEKAQVAALACSESPPGAGRWTVALLTEAARAYPGMSQISRETVRRLPTVALISRREPCRQDRGSDSSTNVGALTAFRFPELF